VNLLDSPWFLLAFLSLFHIIGGTVFGSTLKKMHQDGLSGVRNSGCLLIWGVMFGGMPLAFGLTEFAESGIIWLFPAQLTIFAGAILITYLFGTYIKSILDQKSIKLMAGGGFFFIAGGFPAYISSQEAPWWVSALIGILFCGSGVLLFVQGLRIALKELSAQEQIDRE